MGKKNNVIVIVCLDEIFGKKVATTFAKKLNLLVADCKDLIEYDLFNSGEVISQLGMDYYKKREEKVIKSIFEYENTVINCNFDIFFNNYRIFIDKGFVIYLSISKQNLSAKNVINKLTFDNKDKDMREIADLCVDLDNFDKNIAAKKIFQKLEA